MKNVFNYIGPEEYSKIINSPIIKKLKFPNKYKIPCPQKKNLEK